MSAPIKAWWFCDRDCRLRYGDGRVAEAGITHEIEESPILCTRGFHGSRDILDALYNGYGPICFRIELSGEIVTATDKLVAQRRTYLWQVDAETLLRKFARLCTLDVAHLWDGPDFVVRFLRKGDESLRDTARDAARAAAWAAAHKKQSYILERMIREAHRKESRNDQTNS